jgi:hypothetical protein
MLGTNEQSHRVLSQALSERDDGYSRWMRPSDIIEKNAIERHPRRPARLAEAWQRFLQRIREV